jgi:hypothetical protein
VIVGCCGYGLSKLLDVVASRALAGTIVALGLATIAVAMIPVVQTLLPGAPVAKARMLKPGDALALPDSTRGAVRVLVHGNLAGRGAAVADIVLDLDGRGKLYGQLSRTLDQARVGRRGHTMVEHDHNSEYIVTELPAGVHRLSLDRIDGAVAGAVEVSVFPDRLPLPIEIALACLLVLLASALAARMDAPRASVGGLVCALGFGIMVSRMATPDEAVGPEIGALFISLLGGGLIALITVWLMRKLGLAVPS